VKVSKNLSALRKRAPMIYSPAVLVSASDANKQKEERRIIRTVAAADKVLPDAVKAARLLYSKRYYQRARPPLVKTASLGF
jgi:hypothetical protein